MSRHYGEAQMKSISRPTYLNQEPRYLGGPGTNGSLSNVLVPSRKAGKTNPFQGATAIVAGVSTSEYVSVRVRVPRACFFKWSL